MLAANFWLGLGLCMTRRGRDFRLGSKTEYTSSVACPLPPSADATPSPTTVTPPNGTTEQGKDRRQGALPSPADREMLASIHYWRTAWPRRRASGGLTEGTARHFRDGSDATGEGSFSRKPAQFVVALLGRRDMLSSLGLSPERPGPHPCPAINRSWGRVGLLRGKARTPGCNDRGRRCGRMGEPSRPS